MTDTSRREPMTLTTLGGVRTVTGSRFLVEVGDRRVLVDAGLFQGLKDLRERNWAPFPVSPRQLDAIVITHAHLDHCGYLPRLVDAGFDGPVYVTYDTGKLMSVVLPDSGRLQEEEARYANRAGYSRHSPALALYTEDDAWTALDRLVPKPYDTPFEVTPGVTAAFSPAGHILGSSILRLRLAPSGADPITVTFSGDLGRQQHPLLRPPSAIGDTDWIVVESTYGDREHAEDDSVDRLAALIDRTVARGGKVIIPAFAVDRTEVLLYHLRQLHEAGRLPAVPVYVDSPMALAALSVYREAIDGHADDVRGDLHGDGSLFRLPQLDQVLDAEGSKSVSRMHGPAIVIAGSGMASGGRVVHHLERFLPDPASSVALVGFQAAGTRGRSLMEGAESVKIHGRYVPVRAEICDLSGFSVHADGSELIDWLRTAEREPNGVFVVHGEERASLTLRDRIAHELGWNAVVPQDGERLDLHVAGERHRAATAVEPGAPAAASSGGRADDARTRLMVADHGVLSTVDADRGVHAVPVCFAVVGDHVAVPVDTVKAKRSTDLRRSANTDADPRATLLVDHWDRHDWQQLWWVRADLTRVDETGLDPDLVRRLETGLRDRYRQYRDTPFAGLLVFHLDRLTSWSAA
ncbi:MAG: MBL fold metallo-hydrolase RNA specificity domain-containing protein [Acidimicrobiales bacterium]